MYSSIDQNKLDKAGRFLLDDVVLVSYQSADGSNKRYIHLYTKGQGCMVVWNNTISKWCIINAGGYVADSI